MIWRRREMVDARVLDELHQSLVTLDGKLQAVAGMAQVDRDRIKAVISLCQTYARNPYSNNAALIHDILKVLESR